MLIAKTFLFLPRSKENKAYRLQMNTGKLPVYCNMDGAGLGDCGGGGWTLVMKIDGTKVVKALITYSKIKCLTVLETS